ncbi:MAG: MFS transporter [Clostridiales bacterium]|nr:MFS transporter [Clostridiales bacterium]
MDKFKLTKAEQSWILYDVGNSAFILLITTLVPIYFNSLAETANLSSSEYLAYWGYAGSIATLLVAIIAPFFGTLADRQDYKKKIFLFAVIIGAVSCSILGFATNWLCFLLLFILAKTAYSSSLVFYDAMLPDLTQEDKMDRVSSHGYAFGYIGSCVPFILCLILVLFNEKLGIAMNTAMIFAFLITALWWILFTVPLLKHYKQTKYIQSETSPIKESFTRLIHTFRNMKKQKSIFLFLLAFFFFIDGVYTIIDMATAYGTALGLDTAGLLLALLTTQIVAFPFAILFGRLSSRYNTGSLIKVCILCYTGITLFAVFLRFQWQFWVLAICVGMFQGGIQALSRSYFAKIIPPECSGEYFGIYDIFGKGASLVGTTLVAIISHAFHNESLGVSAIIIIFIIGFALFCKADQCVRSQQNN